MKSYKNPCSQTADFDTLLAVWRKARRGKRDRVAFQCNLDRGLTALQAELVDER